MCSIAPRRKGRKKNMLCTRCDLMKHTQKFNLGCDRSMLTATILANRRVSTQIMYKLIERTRRRRNEYLLRRLHCVRLTLLETSEGEKEKGKKIETHIVPSVTQQSCSRSSNVFTFAHALSQQQDLIITIFFLFVI